MIAEITPLFNAVKNPELNILNPLIINEMAYNRKPLHVISSNTLSYPTNMRERGKESSSAQIVSMTLNIAVNAMLFINKLCNSE